MHNHGDQLTKNYYVFHNTDSGRWSQLLWDLDQTWRAGKFGSCPKGRTTEPTCIRNRLLDAIWADDTFQEMYWRRMQTLVDKHLSPGFLESERERIMANILPEEGMQDALVWGGKSSLWSRNFVTDPYNKFIWDNALSFRRSEFAKDPRMPGPTAQQVPQIVINEINYNPGAGYDAEYLELFNPNEYAVDLSGWEIEGIDLIFRHGTVLGGKQYLVVTNEDRKLKKEHEGTYFVASQYIGKLSNGGELLRLIDANGNLIDEVEYDDSGDWVDGPDGSGLSLTLISTDLENSDPANWVPSENFGGTPGRSNTDLHEPEPALLTVDSDLIVEGDFGVSTYAVDMVLSTPIVGTHTLKYVLESDSATIGAPGESGVDVVHQAGEVTFEQGESKQTVFIQVLGDESIEFDESFSIALTSVGNQIELLPEYQVFIVDNDIASGNDLGVTVNVSLLSLPILSFSNQDSGPGSYGVSDDGNELFLSGNV